MSCPLPILPHRDNMSFLSHTVTIATELMKPGNKEVLVKKKKKTANLTKLHLLVGLITLNFVQSVF